MKYMLVVMLDERKHQALSPHDLQVLDDAAIEWSDGLVRNGHWIAGSALEPSESAITVRVQHGKAVVTDGPFAETNEQLGGFTLVDARDLNEAIHIASRMPCAAYFGGIEIRPVRELVSSADPEKRF